jgi:signal transduction histidine kinase
LSPAIVQVGQFALAGVVALGVVGLGTAIAARRIGEREAITEARATAVARASSSIEPALTDAILIGDPAAVEAVGTVVRLGVLDKTMVRVKLWTPEGKVVYSDEPRLIGTTYTLGAAEQASIRTGAIEAEVSNLAKPENRFERRFGRLLEVYLPVHTPSGKPLLFEAYFPYSAVSSAGSRLWRSFAPITLGALVVLQLVQVPLAASLARRLRDRLVERQHLLQRALDASEIERRRIASELHDGVVQDLAGVAYALSGSARNVADDPARAALLESSAEQVRGSIKALRTLLVELYPPNLEGEGLESALTDLLAGVRARGVESELDTSSLHEPLPAPVAQLLYRGAQEALRNVVRHAQAHTVRVAVANDETTARLSVIDDGHGFDHAVLGGKVAGGHMGLRGLDGLVTDAGGTLRITSIIGGGTTIEVEAPIA